MLKFNPQRSTFVVNMIISIVLTLIVNFSYLITMIVERQQDTANQVRREQIMRITTESEGILHISRDGYGYLLCQSSATENPDSIIVDSVYVNNRKIRSYNLNNGDTIRCTVFPSRNGSSPSLDEVLTQNGAEIPAPVVYDRPRHNQDMAVQILYYFILSLILLTIMTVRFDANNYTSKRYFIRTASVIIATGILYLFAPYTNWMTGQVMFIFRNNAQHMFDWMVMLKCIVIVIVSILYGRIYGMLLVQQKIMLENEHLRNENLQSRYNMLLGQISPHFFFNSLNSLSMLVREQDEDKTLAYIDQLSYTFRYIIQNGQTPKSTLAEEMEFAHAYGEIFKVRYADKFFFDIDIDPKYKHWMLPSLTLQPLIGNAVKHNTITRKLPLHIIIRTEGNVLIVSNRKAPKLEPEPSTGIGLKNLRSRWQLIMGCDIEIKETETEFTVRMPLQKPITD